MLPMRQATSSESENGGREPANVSQGWAQPQSATSGWRRAHVSWLGLFGALSVLGCGGETALPERISDSEDSGVRAPGDNAGGGETPSGTEPGTPNVAAPGIVEGPYPEPPYGTTEGAIIENLELFGWKDPAAAQFDVASGTTVRLGDFYNPDAPGGEGTEYIMLNAVTVWCGVCRTEYQNLEDEQTYAQFAPRGLEIVGVLFEDNNGDPSTFADLSNWSRSYSIDFPFVNDPGFKTGIYFDKSATPMNMIIDARTMEIVLVMTGYNPLIYDEIDRLLSARGR